MGEVGEAFLGEIADAEEGLGLIFLKTCHGVKHSSNFYAIIKKYCVTILSDET
jgi:hypothetical protein